MFEVEAVERFEDIKGVIRSRKSKMDRQYNGQKKMDRQYNGQKQKDKQGCTKHSTENKRMR